MPNQLTTRYLKSSDLDVVADIDEKTVGVRRQSFWEGKIIIQEGSRPPWTSWVAEWDGSVVGFLFCHYEELEFGLSGSTAWIDIIGVDPGNRRHGIAAQLLEDFTYSAEDMGMSRIFTLVSESEHPEVLQFFATQGFETGRMTHFSKSL